MAAIKVQIINKNNGNERLKIIRRSVESNSRKEITADERKQIKDLLHELVQSIVETGEPNEKVFVKIIELSPRVDDSSLLNKFIEDVRIWRSYKEDFDEETEFPMRRYYEELVKIV